MTGCVVKAIAEQVVAPWHKPPGDELYGIQAIADYLELPFLDVRTMLELGRLPAWKTLVAHTSRRTALAAHFLDLEARYVPPSLASPPPADLRPNGSLGLLKGAATIVPHVGCTLAWLQHLRRENGAPIFRLGKHWLARRASIERWRTQVATETPSKRRLATIQARREAIAPPGSIVGSAAMAAMLGIPEAAVFRAIYRGAIPAFRVGKGWAADRADLAEARMKMERKSGDGKCRTA